MKLDKYLVEAKKFANISGMDEWVDVIPKLKNIRFRGEEVRCCSSCHWAEHYYEGEIYCNCDKIIEAIEEVTGRPIECMEGTDIPYSTAVDHADVCRLYKK